MQAYLAAQARVTVVLTAITKTGQRRRRSPRRREGPGRPGDLLPGPFGTLAPACVAALAEATQATVDLAEAKTRRQEAFDADTTEARQGVTLGGLDLITRVAWEGCPDAHAMRCLVVDDGR